MKTTILYICALALVTAVRAADIKLADGKTVYHDAKITGLDGPRVVIVHRTGVAHVLISELPADLRDKYHYDPAAEQNAIAMESQIAADNEKAQRIEQARAKFEGLIAELEQNGQIRLQRGEDYTSAKVWITPLAWRSIDAPTKENFTMAVAYHYHPEYPSVYILDAQSGRELASYGPFQGFVVH